MGIVEEKEQLRKTRRKEMEQEGGTRRKEGGEGGDPRKKEAEVKKRRQKQKVEKVLIEEEEEIVCQGPLMVTKVLSSPLLLIYNRSGICVCRPFAELCQKFHLQAFFVVSLCLFLTSSALLLSDYKEKDSLALRQTVAKLPSLEAPALLANLQPLTSIAREAFVQVLFLYAFVSVVVWGLVC